MQDCSKKKKIAASVCSIIFSCTYFLGDTTFAVHKFESVCNPCYTGANLLVNLLLHLTAVDRHIMNTCSCLSVRCADGADRQTDRRTDKITFQQRALQLFSGHPETQNKGA